MNRNVMPLSAFLLDVCGAFTGLDAPPAARELLDAFDQTGWMITGYRLTESEAGRVLTVALPLLPQGEIVIDVPRLPLLSLVFSTATLGDRPVFEIVEPYGDATYLQLENLRLGLRLRTPLLRPVDGDGGGITLSYSGAVRLHKDWRVRLAADAGLTLAPVEIGRTGIILSANDIQLDLSADRSLPGVTALGLGPDFQGLYARRASVRLLPQIVFGGTPGLQIDFQDVAIGNLGVTAGVRSYHELLHDGHRLDPVSGLVGYLIDPDWQLGLAAVEVELLNNVPRRFFVEGLLRVPVLDALLHCNFGLESGIGQGHTAIVSVRAEPPITFTRGPCTLTLTRCQAEGALGDDRLTLRGTLSGSLTLPGFAPEVNEAALTLEHTPAADSLRLSLREVNFGPLGTVESALLSVWSEADAASGDRQWRVQLETTLAWSDVSGRLHLDQLPDIFPLPPDDARVTAYLEWESGPSTRVTMRLAAELSDVNALWRAVPADYRPHVADAKLTLTATYADSADFQNSAASGTLQGDLAATFALRLPNLTSLPGRELFQFDSGDTDGWISVALRAGTRQGPAGGQEPFLKFEIANPLSVDVQLPGLPQPQAPVHIAVTSVEMDLTAGDAGAAPEGAFTLEGEFRLRPVQPPPATPLSEHLAKLLRPLTASSLVGHAALTLALWDGKAELTLECRFVDAEIEIDIFDMLAGLTRGLSAPDSAMEARGEIDLDLEVGFGLTGVKLQLGSFDPGDSAAGLLFEIAMMMRLGELRGEGFLRFTDAELVVGIGAMEIPLMLPPFPLTRADLDRIRAVPGDPDSLWTAARWQTEIDNVTSLIDQLKGSTATDDLKRLAKARGQKFLLESIHAIYSRMTDAPNRQVYQAGVELIVGAMELTTGRGGLHQDSNVKLQLPVKRPGDEQVKRAGVELVIPFADPRGITVRGSAALSGFAAADPLKPLEDVELTLGISSDQIYFALESAGRPIPLPDFGRYYDGWVSLSRFSLGFGYTRRSLAIAFAGELHLPPQLQTDADTSRRIGFGIGLPGHTRLGFRLDLIPVPGPLPLVPAFEFSLDMNSPGTVGIASTEVCEPFWDGLQFNIPGVVRTGFKKLAYSPLFGVLPIHNVTFDGDLMLGDENNGLTLVMDNLVITAPLGLTVPIPMLASPTDPWVDNLCFNLRIAGFGINFNYRRPLPDFNPLAIFEVLGLLADPMMPIDPNGALANILLISLEEAHITIPPLFLRMFPDLKAVNRKPLHIIVNIGTLISATQAVAAFLRTVWETLERAGNDFARLVNDLTRRPPELSAGVLLSVLPPELRKLRTGGSLAGFDAVVVLLLIAPEDARTEFQRRDAPTQPPATSSQPLHSAAEPLDPERLANLSLKTTVPVKKSRVHHPADKKSNLFRGIEFEAFDETDLAAIPPPRNSQAGMVIGAHVKLPGGQRYRFLGYMFEDGSFGLISAADVKPLHLSVAGVSLTIPLRLDARLVLQGRAKRDGFYGSITATGHALWKINPQVTELEIASEDKPAILKLYSDGRFNASADARLLLFGGGCVIKGSVDLSESHCIVRGHLRYNVAPLEIDIWCSGRVGPGQQYSLAGIGTIKLFGHLLTTVRGLIAEDRAEFEASLNTSRWRVGGTNIECDVDLEVRGRANLRRRTNPEFAFEGQGSIEVFDASIEGRAGLAYERNEFTMFAEGALSWLGRRWLQGRIEIGTERVTIGGRTSFTLRLSPDNITGVHLAHLYFKCDVEGEFYLDNENSLAGCNIRGDWSLGVRPAEDGTQVFPLAAQKFHFNEEATLEVKLIHVKGMSLLPFEDLGIPKPKITKQETDPKVRLGFIDDSLAFSCDGWAIQLLPPIPHERDLTDGETVGKLQTYSLTFDDNYMLSLSGDFIVWLVWYEGRLALRIECGGTEEYWNL